MLRITNREELNVSWGKLLNFMQLSVRRVAQVSNILVSSDCLLVQVEVSLTNLYFS